MFHDLPTWKGHGGQAVFESENEPVSGLFTFTVNHDIAIGDIHSDEGAMAFADKDLTQVFHVECSNE